MAHTTTTKARKGKGKGGARKTTANAKKTRRTHPVPRISDTAAKRREAHVVEMFMKPVEQGGWGPSLSIPKANERLRHTIFEEDGSYKFDKFTKVNPDGSITFADDCEGAAMNNARMYELREIARAKLRGETPKVGQLVKAARTGEENKTAASAASGGHPLLVELGSAKSVVAQLQEKGLLRGKVAHATDTYVVIEPT